MLSDTLYWLWLAHVLGPGAAHCGQALALYGGPRQLHQAVGSEDFSCLLSAAQRERLNAPVGRFEPLALRCESTGTAIITQADERYPRRLLALPDAPPVLYCTGLAGALNARHTVGMIGSRRPSAYGVEAAAAIGGGLAKAGVCLVSGLADGLDSEAHKAAVRAGAPTVGVLGTAIDKTYPAANHALRRQVQQVGAVVSELGPGEASGKGSFLLRNRLIAGLSDLLCVVEAREKSGTMNTVHHAQRYQKPVYAVPGGIFSQLCAGTNRLLAEGTAQAATGSEALLARLGLGGKKAAAAQTKQPGPALSGPGAAMLAQLAQTPRSLEHLAGAAGLAAGEALAALLELELCGLAQSCAGGQYRRK